jgi:hypothetical protein
MSLPHDLYSICVVYSGKNSVVSKSVEQKFSLHGDQEILGSNPRLEMTIKKPSSWPNGKAPDYGRIFFVFLPSSALRPFSLAVLFAFCLFCCNTTTLHIFHQRPSTTMSSSNHGSTLLPQRKRRKKLELPARKQWIATGVKKILQASSDDSTKEVALPVTETALHALVLCHERFMQVVASELVVTMSKSGWENNDKLSYVSNNHISLTMKSLGLFDLVPEAQAAVQELADKKKSAKLSGKKKKKGTWTEAELQEQERLLAQSKDRTTQKPQVCVDDQKLPAAT